MSATKNLLIILACLLFHGASSWAVAEGLGEFGDALSAAEHLSESGLYRSAEERLTPWVNEPLSAFQRAELNKSLALLAFRQGKLDEAKLLTDTGLEYARQANRVGLEAALLNDSGNIDAARGQLDMAAQKFGSAQMIANDIGQSELAFTAAINRARVGLQLRDIEMFESSLEYALADAWTPSAEQWIAVGSLQHAAVRELRLPADWRLKANKSYTRALQGLSPNDEPRLASFALGLQASLYEEEQRYPEALKLTRQAELLAISADADESLYRWQWQSA